MNRYFLNFCCAVNFSKAEIKWPLFQSCINDETIHNGVTKSTRTEHTFRKSEEEKPNKEHNQKDGNRNPPYPNLTRSICQIHYNLHVER